MEDRIGRDVLNITNDIVKAYENIRKNERYLYIDDLDVVQSSTYCVMDTDKSRMEETLLKVTYYNAKMEKGILYVETMNRINKNIKSKTFYHKYFESIRQIHFSSDSFMKYVNGNYERPEDKLTFPKENELYVTYTAKMYHQFLIKFGRSRGQEKEYSKLRIFSNKYWEEEINELVKVTNIPIDANILMIKLDSRPTSDDIRTEIGSVFVFGEGKVKIMYKEKGSNIPKEVKHPVYYTITNPKMLTDNGKYLEEENIKEILQLHLNRKKSKVND